MFRPNLTATHCAQKKKTLLFIERAHVPYASIRENSLYIPHLRPIGDFGGLVKQELYMGGQIAEKTQSPKRRVRCVSRKLDPEVPRKKKLEAGEPVTVAAYHGARDALY